MATIYSKTFLEPILNHLAEGGDSPFSRIHVKGPRKNVSLENLQKIMKLSIGLSAEVQKPAATLNFKEVLLLSEDFGPVAQEVRAFQKNTGLFWEVDPEAQADESILPRH